MIASLLAIFLAQGEPYPLGVEQNSAVGNKKYGWVHISRKVEQRGREYVYTYRYLPRTAGDARLTWAQSEPLEIERGEACEVVETMPGPPVRSVCSLTLEVLVQGAWVRVGVWHQAMPVPPH